MINKIQDEHGSWVFIVPVSNLVLTKDTDFEFKVDRVTFVDSSKLPRIRKRLGFHLTISKFKDIWPTVFERFFGSTQTFATMRLTGIGSEMEAVFLSHVRDELSLLTLSQLGFSRRRHQAAPCVSEEGKTGMLSYLMINAKTQTWTQPNQRTGKFQDLTIDANWLRWQKYYFFPLLDIIRGKKKVSSSWKKDIRNASVLAGQSQQSTDRAKCFLWNMIALELLLTRQGDTYTEMLPNRAEAFLGWTNNWRSENFEERIRAIYKKKMYFRPCGRKIPYRNRRYFIF